MALMYCNNYYIEDTLIWKRPKQVSNTFAESFVGSSLEKINTSFHRKFSLTVLNIITLRAMNSERRTRFAISMNATFENRFFYFFYPLTLQSLWSCRGSFINCIGLRLAGITQTFRLAWGGSTLVSKTKRQCQKRILWYEHSSITVDLAILNLTTQMSVH